MPVEMYDVIIVGAGPAGLSTAYHALEWGLKVLVLEKHRLPREIPCGGFLSAKSTKELPFSLRRNLVESPVRALGYYSLRNKLVSHQTHKPLGVIVQRKNLDAFFAQRVVEKGGALHQQEWPTGITRGKYSVVVTNKGTYHGRYVVGADGVTSTVNKLAKVRPLVAKMRLGLGVRAYVTVPQQKHSPVFEIYNIPVPFGWGWCIPYQGFYNIGIGSTALLEQRIHTHLLTFVKRVMEVHRLPEYQVHHTAGRYIPNGGMFGGFLASRDNILLVGDAAGLLEPVSGEAIYYALRSGRLAANLMAKERAADLTSVYQNTFFKAMKQAFFASLMAPWKTPWHYTARRNPDALYAFENFIHDAQQPITGWRLYSSKNRE